MWRVIGWLAIGVAVTGMAYFRFAPSNAERWHKQAYPSGMGAIPSAGGFVWRQSVTGDAQDVLAKLDAVVQATPRTTRLAGSVGEGQITYVTRSQGFGFPDYATIGIYQGLVEDGDVRYLEIYSRLRFGTSDLGVNRKRVEGWLRVLKAGG